MWANFQRWEVVGAFFFLVGSIGYFCYDIVFGYFSLHCTSDYCITYNARPSASFESNFVTVFFAVTHQVSALSYLLCAYLYVNKRFHLNEHQFWVSSSFEIGRLWFCRYILGWFRELSCRFDLCRFAMFILCGRLFSGRSWTICAHHASARMDLLVVDFALDA